MSRGARRRAKGRAGAAVLFGALGLSPSLAHAAPVRYDGHQVLRVEPRSTAELRDFIELADDVWTERPGVGVPLDIRVSPQTKALVDLWGIDYRVRVPDVQQAVELERERLAAAREPTAAPSEWFSDFRDLATIEDYIDTLAEAAPELVSLELVGESVEGRPIRVLRLNSPATEDKSALLITGTLHAREWLSPMTVMCIAEAMITGYADDPATTDLLDSLELLIVPMVNPDGYEYSWTAERYWRKNLRGGYGVDLNRNWSYGWGGMGASNYPYDEDFRGEGPLSEPETTAVAAFIEANEQLVAHIDVHAFGELVLHPWGHVLTPAPDEVLLSELAGQMSAAIAAVHGHEYEAMQGSALYPASGVAHDWTYGQRGLMAFTFELRGDDFVIGPEQIVPTCEENLEAVWALAQWAREQSEPVPVPDDDGGSVTSGSTTGTLDGDLDDGWPPADADTGLTTAVDGEGGDTTGLPGGTAATAGPPESDEDMSEGCGCGQGDRGSGSRSRWSGLWVLVVLAVRRRPR